MNFSAFHYPGAKTTRCQASLPGAGIVQWGSFKHFFYITLPLVLSQYAETVWISSFESDLFLITLNVFHCLNLQIRSSFLLPSLSLTISEGWIFILPSEINRKKGKSRNTQHFRKDLSTSSGPFMVSMVMAVWFLWGSDEFLFDFDLFMCAATPCCYDCSLLEQTGSSN